MVNITRLVPWMTFDFITDCYMYAVTSLCVVCVHYAIFIGQTSVQKYECVCVCVVCACVCVYLHVHLCMCGFLGVCGCMVFMRTFG